MRRYFWSVVLVLILVGFVRLATDAFSVWNESYLKWLLVPLASAYLTIFSHQLTAVLLSGLMLLSGVVILGWLRLAQIGPAVRALRKVTIELHRIGGIEDGAERLRSVDQILGADRYLARAWRHYRRTLVISSGVGSATRASVRPARYFNLKSLEYGGFDAGLLRSLPSYYVGFGLLFTFMGLVAGLYFASRGLMAADLAAARESLIQLLHTSTFKFSTSVAGLALSLLFSIYGRILIARLDRELDDCCDGLEELFPLVASHFETELSPLESSMVTHEPNRRKTAPAKWSSAAE